MDSSPKHGSIPLREISLRLVEGLQTSVIFPESNYLDNVKAELKKLMKQRYSYLFCLRPTLNISVVIILTIVFFQY